MANGPLDLGGLTVVDLGKRVWAEMSDDNVWDAAAQLGYYFMLALFPLLIFLLSLVAVFWTDPDDNVITPLMNTLRDVMPTQAYQLMSTEIGRILETSGGALLTFGMLGTVWAASSGVVSLIGTLNRAYEAKETRSYFKLRAVAVGLTFGIVVLLIGGSILLTMGDQIVDAVVSALGLRTFGTIIGHAVNYLLGFLLLFAALELIYFFGPNIPDQKWHWVSPGSIAGVLLFVLSSVGFSLYLRFNDSYSVTYGSIGAVIVLMLWLYLLGLSIVIGAEINSEIARAAARRGHPEAPDENVDTAEAEARKDAAARVPEDRREAREGEREADRPAARGADAGAPSAEAAAPKPAAAARPESVGAKGAPRPGRADGARPAARAPLEPSSERASADELVVRDLLAALGNENPHVRAGAAMMARNLKRLPDSVAERLVAMLADEHEEVRTQAARTLERTGTEAA